MHWTLVEFDAPRLATSDHALVLWRGIESRSPSATEITQTGIFECIEARLPLSPTRAVLMTWSDNPDDEHSRVCGTRDHAANLNAFTVTSADRQWFHRPGNRRLGQAGIYDRSPLSSSTATARPQPAPPNDENKSQPAPAGESSRTLTSGDREIDVVWISRRA
jgi:hypothetical protein